MLVLSRKKNEQIVIGDEITITITSLSPSKVGIGIDAPVDVNVRRGELRILDTEKDKGCDDAD